MLRKSASIVMLSLLVACALALAHNVQLVQASETIYINADGSVTGTTSIYTVDNVTYTFTANISDPIEVHRSNIIVDGTGYTLQGAGSYHGITLSNVENVTVENTQITGFGTGIFLDSSSNSALLGNNASGNYLEGAYLHDSSNNTVSGNSMCGNSYDGIYLAGSSSNNTISGNSMCGNSEYGLYLFSSSHNTVSSNNASLNYWAGIWVDNSPNSTITGNDAIGNSNPGPESPTYGIFLNSSGYTKVSDNNASGSRIGIYLNSSYDSILDNTITMNTNINLYLAGGSSNNTVSGNDVSGNSPCGIWLDGSNNTVSSNRITGSNTMRTTGFNLGGRNNMVSCNNITSNINGYGLNLRGISNTLMGNNITLNSWAIVEEPVGGGTIIYHNNFYDNSNPAYSFGGVEVWDSGYPSGGNYWSGIPCVDTKCGQYQNETGSDGIADQPYITSGVKDHYPLVNRWTTPSGHDVKVISLVSAKTVICQGYSGNITVYGANRGEYPEGFNVTAYANTTKITSETVHNLGSDSTTTIKLVWTATDSSFPIGNYTLKAYAEPVPGETNVYDNNFTGGWVMVTRVGDVSMDNKVDGRDLIILSRAFVSYGPGYDYPDSPATLGWNPDADITNDNKVDGRDLLIASRHFGEGI